MPYKRYARKLQAQSKHQVNTGRLEKRDCTGARSPVSCPEINAPPSPAFSGNENFFLQEIIDTAQFNDDEVIPPLSELLHTPLDISDSLVQPSSSVAVPSQQNEPRAKTPESEKSELWAQESDQWSEPEGNHYEFHSSETISEMSESETNQQSSPEPQSSDPADEHQRIPHGFNVPFQPCPYNPMNAVWGISSNITGSYMNDWSTYLHGYDTWYMGDDSHQFLVPTGYPPYWSQYPSYENQYEDIPVPVSAESVYDRLSPQSDLSSYPTSYPEIPAEPSQEIQTPLTIKRQSTGINGSVGKNNKKQPCQMKVPKFDFLPEDHKGEGFMVFNYRKKGAWRRAISKNQAS